ncbi:uncharacterized protein LOC111910515 [Lactuca sativa]|uniref:uncharacterized protein LOC111910515 n=1 Tax=Lactuca sativa TaxID=4236 RepID=UPI000CD7FB25|nr:uncharacterized protein LOC111910515 [Lactuca sativa]
MGDSGSITVPCQFGNITTTRALTDSGESINTMSYSFFRKLNLPVPKPIHMKIHLADKTIIHPMRVCEDLLIKVDKLVFLIDFIILDMEENLKVPIILGRPFLNTACALIDMHESTLTLRVGDDSVIFKAAEKDKHIESIEDKVSSIDLEDELLEKELTCLHEINPNVHVLPDYVENLLEESKVVKDFVNFENAHLACLETIVLNDEAAQEEDKESLEDKGDTKTWNNDNHKSFIESHIAMSTKSKRTKPRALVFTTFEVFTFKTPDSLICDKSEEEIVPSSDDEMMTEKAIEEDKKRKGNDGA